MNVESARMQKRATILYEIAFTNIVPRTSLQSGSAGTASLIAGSEIWRSFTKARILAWRSAGSSTAVDKESAGAAQNAESLMPPTTCSTAAILLPSAEDAAVAATADGNCTAYGQKAGAKRAASGAVASGTARDRAVVKSKSAGDTPTVGLSHLQHSVFVGNP